ncbi:cation:proton antiporter [Rhodococcus sp. HNM0569]|uniref:cation:proton antiporter n=1 Tax=Rhodococcus sp. HNM0569 TaxID=2716340 RepID=UPI00146EDBA9|nr:cation:proton antiporter [Rhodococcus sp. HNM0569]NLU83638.1 cation:proton antiporter [Rhodococcus sp. HNM0569]
METAVPAALAGHSLLVLLVQLAVLLAAAVALGRLAVRVGLPAITGELFAGVVLGPSLLGQLRPGMHAWLFPSDTAQFHLLDAVTQVGLYLFVGLAAAQLDVEFLGRHRRTVALVSVCAFAVPLALGIATGTVLPDSLAGEGIPTLVFALFLGTAMSVSAVPVIAKTLAELNLLHRNVGQLTLISGATNDAMAWILLAVTAAAAASATAGGSGEGSASHVAVTVVAIVGVAVAALVVRKPVGQLVTALHSRADDSPTLVLPVVVALVLGCAAGTQALGVEAVLGAFAAGFVLSSVPAAALAPLRTVVLAVFAPLFLASAGLRVDLSVFRHGEILVAALVVLVVAVIGKFAGAYAGARLARMPRWESFALGAGLNARGAVEIVIALIGVSLGVLTDESYAIIVFVAVATSVMAAPFLRAAMKRVDVTVLEQQRLELMDGPNEPAADDRSSGERH